MERLKRKAINFDLNTNRMKELDLYPKGYRLLGNSLHRQGFTHRQGSGYVSKGKIDSLQVNRAILAIVKENPWLAECVKKIDVTDIGNQHDLTMVVKDAMQSQEIMELEDLEEIQDFEQTM